MKKKSNPMRIAPLLECEAIPITDPAEIEALERRIRKAEKMLAARESKPRKTKPPKRK
jgi:hypothetical protein